MQRYNAFLKWQYLSVTFYQQSYQQKETGTIAAPALNNLKTITHFLHFSEYSVFVCVTPSWVVEVYGSVYALFGVMVLIDEFKHFKALVP